MATHRILLFVASTAFLAPLACSSSDDARAPTGAASPATPEPDADAGPSPSPPPSPTKDAGVDAAPATKPLPPIETNAQGCITFKGAASHCGGKSDRSICTFAVECGISKDFGSCTINCEMRTTLECYAQDDAQCQADAVAAGSCEALRACAWRLDP